jgi:AraC-like DNA-binding protein
MRPQQKKFILGLLAYAAQRDIDAELLCRYSAITLDELNDASTGLSAKQVNDIWTSAVKLSGDENFGLHFGESLQLSAIGMVGEIIKSSSTVGEALTIAASLTHLVTSDFELKVAKDAETFSVNFEPVNLAWRSSVSAVQMLDLLMVFVIHELDGLMIRKIKPMSASFMRPITDIHEFERVMRCKPKDEADANRIVFDQCYWNEPIITANYALQNQLLLDISPLLNLNIEKQALRQRVYHYLLTNSYLGAASLDDIAANFNLSARTLQRRLRDEDISFQQLADEARKTLAINYLRERAHPVKQISYMLGYNELSAFSRTFKRWTGTTPISFQKNLVE